LHLRKIYIKAFIVTALLFAGASADAQLYKLRGTVYDSSRLFPMEAVTVQSTSGKGTITNIEGHYELEVSERDSVWFSYLNKPTIKFPVINISNPMAFDISLQVNVPVMKEVKIRLKNYRQDSIQNRLDYAKIFNYEKPGLKTVSPSFGGAAGFDLDEIINMFRFKRNKSIASFQKRLIQEEEEVFVTHRFSKQLVRRLAPLDGESLDSFMRVFRPPYLFTRYAGDYDFQLYIKQAYNRYLKGLPPEVFYKEEEE
jgi:hypothetical protein